jgi:hypothetical protein
MNTEETDSAPAAEDGTMASPFSRPKEFRR